MVDAAGRRGKAGLERRVDLAHRLPVRLQVADGLQVQAGGRGRCGRWRRRAPTATAGEVVPAIDATAAVDGVRAGLDRGEVGGELAARRCRGCAGAPAGRIARAARSPACGRPAARSSPAMSLIARTWAPGLDDLLGQAQVVVEGVELLVRVRQVRGVAERDLGDAPCRSRVRRRSPGRIWATSLSASKIRKMSMPVLGGLGDERVGDLRPGTACSPTVLRPRSSICRQMFGTASRSAASRSHGSSARKRSATS